MICLCLLFLFIFKSLWLNWLWWPYRVIWKKIEIEKNNRKNEPIIGCWEIYNIIIWLIMTAKDILATNVCPFIIFCFFFQAPTVFFCLFSMCNTSHFPYSVPRIFAFTLSLSLSHIHLSYFSLLSCGLLSNNNN